MPDLFKNAETEITCTNCSVCTQFWPSGCVPLEGGGNAIGWNFSIGWCAEKKKNVAGTSTCEKFDFHDTLPRDILLSLNAGERVTILSNAYAQSSENRKKAKLFQQK